MPAQVFRAPGRWQSAQEGGKVINPKHRPPLPPGYTPSTHFRERLSRPQDHSAARGIKAIKNFNDPIGNRTIDLLRLVAQCLNDIQGHSTSKLRIWVGRFAVNIIK
jgi:hypothetical protein